MRLLIWNVGRNLRDSAVFKCRAALVTIALGAISVSHAADLVEYSCGMPLKSGSTFEFMLLGRTEADSIRFPSDIQNQDGPVTCARSMLVPSESDALVLAAGFKLFIGAPAGDSGMPRMAIYVGEKPNIGFVAVSGELTRQERRMADRVLKKINAK